MMAEEYKIDTCGGAAATSMNEKQKSNIAAGARLTYVEGRIVGVDFGAKADNENEKENKFRGHANTTPPLTPCHRTASSTSMSVASPRALERKTSSGSIAPLRSIDMIPYEGSERATSKSLKMERPILQETESESALCLDRKMQDLEMGDKFAGAGSTSGSDVDTSAAPSKTSDIMAESDEESDGEGYAAIFFGDGPSPTHPILQIDTLLSVMTNKYNTSLDNLDFTTSKLLAEKSIWVGLTSSIVAEWDKGVKGGSINWTDGTLGFYLSPKVEKLRMGVVEVGKENSYPSALANMLLSTVEFAETWAEWRKALPFSDETDYKDPVASITCILVEIMGVIGAGAGEEINLDGKVEEVMRLNGELIWAFDQGDWDEENEVGMCRKMGDIRCLVNGLRGAEVKGEGILMELVEADTEFEQLWSARQQGEDEEEMSNESMEYISPSEAVGCGGVVDIHLDGEAQASTSASENGEDAALGAKEGALAGASILTSPPTLDTTNILAEITALRISITELITNENLQFRIENLEKQALTQNANIEEIKSMIIELKITSEGVANTTTYIKEGVYGLRSEIKDEDQFEDARARGLLMLSRAADNSANKAAQVIMGDQICGLRALSNDMDGLRQMIKKLGGEASKHRTVYREVNDFFLPGFEKTSIFDIKNQDEELNALNQKNISLTNELNKHVKRNNALIDHLLAIGSFDDGDDEMMEMLWPQGNGFLSGGNGGWYGEHEELESVKLGEIEGVVEVGRGKPSPGFCAVM